MNKIVILKQPFTNSQQGNLLRNYLRIIFPECSIEIRENRTVYLPDEKIFTASDDVRPLPSIGFGRKTRK